MQISQVCVSGSGPVGLTDRRIESPVAGARCLCLFLTGNPGTSGLQVVGPRLSQNDSCCTWVAKHALVLGSGQHVSANFPLSAFWKPSDPAIQRVSTQGSPNTKSAWLAPRATAIQQ